MKGVEEVVQTKQAGGDWVSHLSVTFQVEVLHQMLHRHSTLNGTSPTSCSLTE